MYVLARIVLALAIGAVCLSPASAAVSGQLLTNSGRSDTTGATADRGGKLLPGIVVVSPKSTSYTLGQNLLVKFSCTAPSGIAHCPATISRVGEKTVKVISGRKMRLSGTGRYVLRITAEDRRGNFCVQDAELLRRADDLLVRLHLDGAPLGEGPARAERLVGLAGQRPR